MDINQKKQRVLNLMGTLNRYRHLYYNGMPPEGSERLEEITDAEYDAMFDELRKLEEETGLVMSTSPTQSVGAPVLDHLTKVRHPIPLLSLDKTKDVDAMRKFIGDRPTLFMLKLDGLTIELDYEGGELVQASTRGDGDEGEDITHNARMFRNIPLRVPYKGKLKITGEAIIKQKDFELLRDTLVGNDGKPYKNARNLAAGSVRQLDAAESAKRRVNFIAFRVLEGPDGMSVTHRPSGRRIPVDTNSKYAMLMGLKELGFRTVFTYLFNAPDPTTPSAVRLAELAICVTQMKEYAENMGLPIDGLVASYDDVAYSNSLGRTGHHYLDGLAFKFEDETEETVLREVEWNVTRTGELSAVAIFDPVELDGTEVSRATLHNLDFIKKLNLKVGNRITVSKRNMIIPQIEENLDRDTNAPDDFISVFPKVCPSCGGFIIAGGADENGEGANLFCSNIACPGRKLRQLVHYASKKAMDIDGLSEGTLKILLDGGLVVCEEGLYSLHEKASQLRCLPGFGASSAKKLIDAIERSRDTTVEKFIIAMDIPEIGRHASAILCKAFNYDPLMIEVAVKDGFDFTVLEDFGDVLNNNIHAWFADAANAEKWERIYRLLRFKTPALTPALSGGNPFTGKTVVATGSFENFTRDSINEFIASLGAKAGSSVSAKTDFVIAGEKAGGKKQKAEELGVRVLTEAEFMEMAKQ